MNIEPKNNENQNNTEKAEENKYEIKLENKNNEAQTSDQQIHQISTEVQEQISPTDQNKVADIYQDTNNQMTNITSQNLEKTEQPIIAESLPQTHKEVDQKELDQKELPQKVKEEFETHKHPHFGVTHENIHQAEDKIHEKQEIPIASENLKARSETNISEGREDDKELHENEIKPKGRGRGRKPKDLGSKSTKKETTKKNKEPKATTQNIESRLGDRRRKIDKGEFEKYSNMLNQKTHRKKNKE